VLSKGGGACQRGIKRARPFLAVLIRPQTTRFSPHLSLSNFSHFSPTIQAIQYTYHGYFFCVSKSQKPRTVHYTNFIIFYWPILYKYILLYRDDIIFPAKYHNANMPNILCKTNASFSCKWLFPVNVSFTFTNLH
jgi:hypothetical protein